MWPRVVEVMLGVWLALSPFIFGHAADQKTLWAVDLGCAAVVVLFALLSFYQPLRLMHVGQLLVAAVLLSHGYLGHPHPRPPAWQNQLLLGLLLLMFGIIPSDASRPPLAWRRYLQRTRNGTSK